MVRNLIGGCQAKRLGRKFSNNVGATTELRLSTNKFELYACVTKIYGGTCCVKTVDDEELLCTIRNKFKGRSKRNNLITIGCIVLVGVFEWQNIDSKSKKKCDLLTIYDSIEYEKLLLLPDSRVNRLEKYSTASICMQNGNGVLDDFLFSNDEVKIKEGLQEKKKSGLKEEKKEGDEDEEGDEDGDGEGDGDEVNIDDI
jgi:hypothetical protein